MTYRRPVYPWRTVVGEPGLRSGRGSLLGPDTSRRTRWWEGTLDCGHTFERTVRYRPDPSARNSGGWRARPRSAVLPPPKRVRCDECPRLDP